MLQRAFLAALLPLLLLPFIRAVPLGAQPAKLVVAYSSAAATFSPGWIAKREGLFARHNLDVEMVLMQGPSTYMPALASGNIQVMYGGGTAISRAIGTGGFDLVMVATETRYVPMRLMVVPAIRSAADLRGKRLGVGRAGLDEYAALLYLDRVGLVAGKDVQIVYMAGGIPNRATAMKQGLVDGVVVNPPNEYELEKAGYLELANFLDFKMPYAGVPQTVMKPFRDRNRRVVEDYIGAIVEAMQLFRANRELGYRVIAEATRQNDPVILARTYDSYSKQYDAIGGLPFPWQAGIEGMITGFHERFTPQGIKNRDARPYLDSSFVQRAAERLKLDRK